MPFDIAVGDIITTKKNHPCGSYEFEIMRVGMDFRIKCLGCEKQIWIERRKFEKRIKKIIREGQQIEKKEITYSNEQKNVEL